MPVHPSEEEAPTGLTEAVAKNPSSSTDSTASEHASHQNEHTPGDGVKATAQDFQSKGPQIPTSMDGSNPCERLTAHADGAVDMPPKASKEELKARAEELNK